MAKMVALRKTAADKKADEHAGADRVMAMPANAEDDEGPALHLSQHHLDKMGVEGDLPEGHEIEFRGRVEAHQHGHEGGEHKGHARIRITHGGMEKPDKHEQGSLREELKKHHGDAEKKRKDEEAKRAAKKIEKHEDEEIKGE